jgi:hypothetical protein
MIPLNSKQIVSFEELLMSQVVQQEALTRLLVENPLGADAQTLLNRFLGAAQTSR